jgi:DNA repair protein RecN (Recombination protein N)
LARIASTGELSRFTLALKSVLAEADSIPVIVFDEIDIGIGGRSGEIIGKKLWGLSQNSQVICVTHLPQIVAFADAHFRIHKETSGDRTLAILEELNAESRVEEMAAMISGVQYTESALDSAREIMRKAQMWKEAAS